MRRKQGDYGVNASQARIVEHFESIPVSWAWFSRKEYQVIKHPIHPERCETCHGKGIK
jgi:hypothetical protein